MSNLPSTSLAGQADTKQFFDKFFINQVSFPAAEIDATVGFFLKRSFDIESARSTGIVLLNQARLDNVNVFQLLDTLKAVNDAQLSSVVTEVLNAYRGRTSTLGYKILTVEETTESRNIRP